MFLYINVQPEANDLWKVKYHPLESTVIHTLLQNKYNCKVIKKILSIKLLMKIYYTFAFMYVNTFIDMMYMQMFFLIIEYHEAYIRSH